MPKKFFEKCKIENNELNGKINLFILKENLNIHFSSIIKRNFNLIFAKTTMTNNTLMSCGFAYSRGVNLLIKVFLLLLLLNYC